MSSLSDQKAGAPLIDLNGRTIFITGGTGFIGRTLLDFFLRIREQNEQKFTVQVLSRNAQKFLSDYPRYNGLSWLSFLTGDIESLKTLDTTCTDVIHAAADTHHQGKGVVWIEQIVIGTRIVLDFAIRSGAKRFLFTSSGAIYGPQPAEVAELQEDYNGAPATTLQSSIYGQSKRLAEQLCSIYYHEYNLETVSARCFAFAGEHLPLSGPYAIGNFIHDALFEDVIKIRGDGKAVRSYLDGEDLAYWLIFLLCRGAAGEVYNIGSDHPVTMLELAELVSNTLSPGKKIVMESSGSTDGSRSRYVPCIKKMADLGLTPKYSLDEIIQRVAYLHKDLHIVDNSCE